MNTLECIATRLLPAAPESIKKARDFVAEECRALGLGEAAVHLARTVASELATNAYQHGSDGERDHFVVRFYSSDAGPVVEMWDGSVQRPEILPVGCYSESGRGMGLIEMLAVSWGVAPLDGGQGKAVWALLKTHTE
ncbi:ATP-binding protein [Spirillospora sp. CA-294931]|uniref:ATP-binding protein n=1 Tax=Spirillospora sp. CA-294931 TaxID=3240042 RepID=UPI003D8E117B